MALLLLKARPRAAAVPSRVLLRAQTDSGEHWVTIGGHEAGDEKHKGGTPVLLDSSGRIIGGSVPRAFHGLSIKEMGDDRSMQRHWKIMQRALKEAQQEVERQEGQIPSLARTLQREADAGRRHMIARIREVTEGQMITPDATEENREIPSYFKRDPNKGKATGLRAELRDKGVKVKGSWNLDAVADAMGMTENELRHQLIELDRRHKTADPEEFRREAEEMIRGDESHRDALQSVQAIKDMIGGWTGPKKTSDAAERTRKWRERLKAEGRTENKHPRRREAMARSAPHPALGAARDPGGRYSRRGSRGHWNRHLVLYRRERKGRRGKRSEWQETVRRWHGERGERMPPEQGIGPRIDPAVASVGAYITRSRRSSPEVNKVQPGTPGFVHTDQGGTRCATCEYFRGGVCRNGRLNRDNDAQGYLPKSARGFAIVDGPNDCCNFWEAADRLERSRTADERHRDLREHRGYLNRKERGSVRARFGDRPGCSFARDKNGIYAYTHRCRSKSYPTVEKIPKHVVRFIESTG